MKNQKGFSLIELLVVVIIIAIIAAIAIPSLLASRRAANEGSAISSLRIYHSAQATWYSTTGATNVYATQAQLGTAGLVDNVLGANAATATKSGYVFINAASAAGATASYCAAAAPADFAGADATGTREFGVGSVNGGQIVAATATSSTPGGGAITCAAGLLTGGTAIGN